MVINSQTWISLEMNPHLLIPANNIEYAAVCYFMQNQGICFQKFTNGIKVYSSSFSIKSCLPQKHYMLPSVGHIVETVNGEKNARWVPQKCIYTVEPLHCNVV